MNWIKFIIVSIMVMAVCLGISIHIKYWNTDLTGQDIYYSWVEGKRILQGENPYSRILSGDMRQNQKYATYFPLFYLFSALLQILGLKYFMDWLFFWRIVVFLTHFGIAGIIFYLLYQKQFALLAVFGASFCLLNRWTLYVVQVAHVDFLAILFLLISLIFFSRNRKISYLSLGISLAVKQIAVFLIPLYLIWIWNSGEKDKLKKSSVGLLWILMIPVICSLPFLIWNAEGFIRSILFSLTRRPESHMGVISMSALLGWEGIPAKFMMFILMGLVYFIAYKWEKGFYFPVLLIFSVFISFNSVLFIQYMTWMIPFIPLSICDWDRETNTKFT